MNPLSSAISSMQAIFSPCRCSRVCTNSDDDSSESNVPASSQATPRPSGVTRQLALAQVVQIHVGDLQFAAGRRLQALGDLDHGRS